MSTNVTIEIDGLNELATTISGAINVLWLFLCGVLVFFMQAGFGMLEAGSVQTKNVRNILVKNIADVLVSGVSFWLFGFGFAYGGTKDFIGDKDYFGGSCLDEKYHSTGCTNGFIDWFFQFAFAATAATIVSGSVAERTKFICYICYSLVLTGFVYPVVAHWVWGGGWLSEHVNDFAGSGVVHMVGGCAGLVGAIVIGPRKGRFEGERFNVKVKEFDNHSIVFAGLGVFILWTGWYGFNAGSTLALAGNEAVAELVVINTTLAPCAAGLVCTIVPGLMTKFKGEEFQVLPELIFNGVLAGLVSITAGCNVMEPSLAFVTGIIGGFVYLASSQLLEQLMIDDPLDAAPIHYFCGAWGVIAVGFFATENYRGAGANYGAFYGDEGFLLGWQLCEVVVLTAWTAGFSLLIFVPLKMAGLARVNEEVEEEGLDTGFHGGRVNSMMNIPTRKRNSAPTKVAGGEEGL